MAMYFYLWSDELKGNRDKVEQHGLTAEDWEFVFENFEKEDISRASGRPIRIGDTADGRRVCVVFEWLEGDWSVLPITGYEI